MQGSSPSSNPPCRATHSGRNVLTQYSRHAKLEETKVSLTLQWAGCLTDLSLLRFNLGPLCYFSRFPQPTRDQPHGARVLLASVRNVLHPLTVDTFHTLFSRFGEGQLNTAAHLWSPTAATCVFLAQRSSPASLSQHSHLQCCASSASTSVTSCKRWWRWPTLTRPALPSRVWTSRRSTRAAAFCPSPFRAKTA